MTKAAQKFLKENIPYYGEIPSTTRRGKDALAKKTWCIVSDYVRMRDWLSFGVCVSCKSILEQWRDSDAAHYHSFSGNGAFSAFNDMNIHMSCKTCNGFRGAAAGYEMAEELKKRYGQTIIPELYKAKLMTVKADSWFYMDKIMEIYGKYQELKRQYPDELYPEYLS